MRVTTGDEYTVVRYVEQSMQGREGNGEQIAPVRKHLEPLDFP